MYKYKTWKELHDYAIQRALNSANRNGHQEFSYWLRIARWAEFENAANTDIFEHLSQAKQFIEHYAENRQYHRAAEQYAYAVHLRKMLIAQGVKVPRLSLEWLREAARDIEKKDTA